MYSQTRLVYLLVIRIRVKTRHNLNISLFAFIGFYL